MVRRVLIALLVVGALNAFGGGIYGMTGARGVPLSWLERSPFESYFGPSLILFFVVGGWMAMAAAALLARFPAARAAALAAGVVLLGWIVVQVAMIGWVSWLQPVSAAVGLVLMVLASLLPADARVGLRRSPPIRGVP